MNGGEITDLVLHFTDDQGRRHTLHAPVGYTEIVLSPPSMIKSTVELLRIEIPPTITIEPAR